MTLGNAKSLRLLLATWFADRCAGASLAFGVAYLAQLLGNWSSLPAMAMALALGIALREALPEPRFEAGYSFVAGNVLRFGIVLLGARLTLGDVAGLGWGGVLVASSVALGVFSCGLLLGRVKWIGPELGLVAGGAVAICGASAAAAMAALLPASPRREQALMGAVAGVSLIGAILMLIYPPLLTLLGVPPRLAGLIVGASIHDVAQAVGAGYMLGSESGDIATIAKLLRVAWLAPLVLLAGLACRGAEAERKPGQLIQPPLFLLCFIALFGFSAFNLLPQELRQVCDTVSRFCLLAAIAAMGLRTTPASLLRHGGPALLLVLCLSLIAIVLAAGGSLALFYLHR